MHFLKRKKLLLTIAIEMIGCFLSAVGVYNFALPAQFPITGFSGISIIINRFYHIPIGVIIIVLNLPVALLCFRPLGKRFFFHSLWCMLLSSLMMDYLAPLLPVYSGNRLLAALCCGLITGSGYAIIYMQNASTGGADFITMSIKSWKPHISLGKIMLFSDFSIIVAGGMLFHDIDGIIYGLIVSGLSAIVVDKLMYGVNAGKVMLIVTSHSKLIAKVIAEISGRGSTVWKAQGSYRNEEREMVLCACDGKQMYLVKNAVKQADPVSFIIILESNEVHGEGFAPIVLGEKHNYS